MREGLDRWRGAVRESRGKALLGRLVARGCVKRAVSAAFRSLSISIAEKAASRLFWHSLSRACSEEGAARAAEKVL